MFHVNSISVNVVIYLGIVIKERPLSSVIDTERVRMFET